MKLTMTWLKAQGACEEALAAFRRAYPGGRMTARQRVAFPARLVRAHPKWAERLISCTPLYAEYLAQRTPLWDEYERQHASLSAEYECQLYAAYVRQRALLLREMVRRLLADEGRADA